MSSSRSVRVIALLCFAVLLQACTTPGTLTDRNWQMHRDLVAATTDWTLQGRLNIRQDNSSDTVTINWQQLGQDFEINLSGRLGLGATLISGNASMIRMQRGNEEPVLAANLSDLSRDLLGYEFPADSLFYWTRGIPAPGNPASLELNEQQLLGVLNQRDSQGNNWRLEYDRYQNYQGLSLPGRIRMTHTGYQLTLIIQDWQLAPGA